MTVRINKPAFNIREKLTELDFFRLPFQKMPPGSIIQVESTYDTDHIRTTTSTAYVDIMEATITPKRSDSKILIMVTLQAMSGGSFAGHYAVLKRGSTSICAGDAAGNRNRATFNFGIPSTYDQDQSTFGPGNLSITHLDSPATTSAVTYGLYHADATGTNELYINRATADTDSTSYERTASSITVMEVSG